MITLIPAVWPNFATVNPLNPDGVYGETTCVNIGRSAFETLHFCLG